MAKAPQKVTRATDFQTGAPPARAAKPPNKARKMIGADSHATLRPELRNAVISRSDDIRPSTSKIPVRIPAGIA